MIPSDYSKLIKLPGVGEYTARAIEGIAYNKSVMPIDTNIRRIIARLYCITKPLYSQKKEINLYVETNNIVDEGADLTHHLSDHVWDTLTSPAITSPRNVPSLNTPLWW